MAFYRAGRASVRVKRRDCFLFFFLLTRNEVALLVKSTFMLITLNRFKYNNKMYRRNEEIVRDSVLREAILHSNNVGKYYCRRNILRTTLLH